MQAQLEVSCPLLMTVLEVTDGSGGWVPVSQPVSFDEALAVAKVHGDGFYCFTRQDAYIKAVGFFIVSGGVVMNLGSRRATVAEAADEFSRKCYKIHLPAALKWKLELVIDYVDAYTALHKAVPDLPWKPHALAGALTEAWVKRFGDGVITRECGDIAIRTAKVKTVSEIRQFLRGFAESYLKEYLAAGGVLEGD